MLFNISTKLYFGKDSIRELKNLELHSICIIADPFLLETDGMEQIKSILHESQIEYKIFSDILPDAPLQKIVEGVEKLDKNGHRAILAIGGGSALDTAKAIGFFHNKVFENKEKIKVIAVPTTSGTGSEVTRYVVIKDSETGKKYPLNDEALLPDIALLDTNFVMTMPSSVARDTGFDVLTHAIEAYVATTSNTLTDMFAIEAIKNVFQYLPQSVNEQNALEAREKMHLSSTMAGLAFDQSGLGITHSLAHSIGANFGVPHGKANGILLPYIVEYNGRNMENNKYLDIADILGVEGFSSERKFNNFIKWIEQLQKKVNMPHSLSELGIMREEFIKKKEIIVEDAMKDRCTATNPVQLSINDFQIVLETAYSGRKPLNYQQEKIRSGTVVASSVIGNPSITI